MKKALLVIALVFMALTAKAQLYVGGGIGFSAAGPQFGFYPEVGYNFNDNMAAGLPLGFAFGNGMFDFSIDPYFRYYFADWGPARFFADANFKFLVESMQGQSATGWGIGIRPGIAFDINDRFSIVTHIVTLGYYYNAFTFNLNTGSTIGLYYNF